MWIASMLVALAEVILYSGLTLWLMLRAGSGTGVWIPMIPFGWFAFAIFLWIPMRLAQFLMFIQSDSLFENKAIFGCATMVVLLLLGFIFSVLIGFNNSTAKSIYISISLQMIWQLIAVLLAIRLNALSSHRKVTV